MIISAQSVVKHLFAHKFLCIMPLLLEPLLELPVMLTGDAFVECTTEKKLMNIDLHNLCNVGFRSTQFEFYFFIAFILLEPQCTFLSILFLLFIEIARVFIEQNNRILFELYYQLLLFLSYNFKKETQNLV